MKEAGKEPSIYPPVIDYLRKKHQSLRNGYRTDDRKFVESCTKIASDIAELLLQDGKKPSILKY